MKTEQKSPLLLLSKRFKLLCVESEASNSVFLTYLQSLPQNLFSFVLVKTTKQAIHLLSVEFFDFILFEKNHRHLNFLVGLHQLFQQITPQILPCFDLQKNNSNKHLFEKCLTANRCLREILFQIDHEQKWCFLNTDWRELTEFSLASSLHSPSENYVHLNDRCAYQQALNHLFTGVVTTQQMKLRLNHKKGHSIWGEMFLCAYFSPQGTVRGITGVLRTLPTSFVMINELKTGQLQWQEYIPSDIDVLENCAIMNPVEMNCVESLEGQESDTNALYLLNCSHYCVDHCVDPFQVIFEKAPVGIAKVTLSGNFVQVNQSLIEFLGYSYEELLNQTIQDISHPDDFQTEQLLRQQLLQEKIPLYSIDHRYLCKDNYWRWGKLTVSVLRDSQGNPESILLVIEDISDRKKTEEDLRTDLQQEKVLNTMKTNLLAMTSHEFRNPLTAIMGVAKMQKKLGHKLTPEQKEQQMNLILSASQRMLNLLEDLLMVGQAQSGQLKFDPKPCDLFAFCEELIQTFTLGDQLEHAIAFFYTNSSSSTLFLDGKLLHHILDNLLSNALKYSPPGTEISLYIKVKPPWVEIEVKDQGCGIDPEEQTHLFEPFYRCSNTSEIRGTGLGLSIVKQAVEIHRGKIYVNSALGKGTAFKVILPCQMDLTQNVYSHPSLSKLNKY